MVAYLYQFHSELYQRWHYDSAFPLRLRDWLTNAVPADDKSEPHLARLSLPTQLRASDPTGDPGSGSLLESRYPDPAAPGIFWIAPLLQITLNKASPQEFEKLLKLAV